MPTLRSAKPDDAAEVAGVHVRSWQVGYRGLLPDEYLDRLRSEDRVGRYTFAETGLRRPATVVAVDNGRAGLPRWAGPETRTWRLRGSCTPSTSTRRAGGEAWGDS